MAIAMDTSSPVEGVSVVRVRGELTLAETEEFGAALRRLEAQGAHDFIFDMTVMTVLDSVRLGALAGLSRRVHPAGPVWLAGVSPMVSKTLQITGLSRVLHPATVDDALAQCSSPAR